MPGNVANAGTLQVSSGAITLTGNWSNSGTFTQGTSTVTLNGTNQSISGTTTFYGLSKTVTTAYTLTFEATETQTVTDSLTLKGASGQLLSIRSSVADTQAALTLDDGSQDLDYLDVKDSDASGGDVLAAGVNSTNSGNNDNWTFKIISVTLRDAGDTTGYTTWAIGTDKAVDTVYLMDIDNCVLVKNDGNVAEDFSIIVSGGTGTNWTLATTNAQNQCVLMGLFNGNAAPIAGNFSPTHDIIDGDTRWATESTGDGIYEGANDGDNVAVGEGEKLYIYLETPLTVTSGLQETITVTIGAREDE